MELESRINELEKRVCILEMNEETLKQEMNAFEKATQNSLINIYELFKMQDIINKTVFLNNE